MAHIAKLDNGKWKAVIRHPSGRRYSKTDPLKRVVIKWAAAKESEIRRGEFIDPTAGRMTLAQWWGRWSPNQGWAAATRDKNGSWWRNHIEPKFGTWPMSAIHSWDVEGWVTGMNGVVGAETVASSLRLLSQMLTAAVNSRPPLLGSNPALLVKAPAPPEHVDRFLSRAEAERLLGQFTGEDRLFVEVLLYCGLRWSEAANLKSFRVDLLRKRLQVAKVRDRRGNEKGPKTKAGARPVPLTDELVIDLSRHIAEPGDVLVFTSPEGAQLRYGNWLRRVWAPALKRAGLDDPQPTPHDLRHTYGSWLGEAGMPSGQIAALMGHSTQRSVERYIHATEARFDQARDALASGRKVARGVIGSADSRG